MSSATDWNSLIGRCLAGGNDRDWHELVVKMAPVIRSVSPHGADSEWLRDFAQEVVLRLCEDDCRRLRMFDPSRGVPFPAYLRVIAARLRISLWRAQGTSGPVVELNHVTDALGIEPDTWRRLEVRELRDATGSLPPQQQAAVGLLLDGLTVKEIANVLGLHDGGAAALLWRARQSLRELLGRAP